jgi:hypothetical protein
MKKLRVLIKKLLMLTLNCIKLRPPSNNSLKIRKVLTINSTLLPLNSLKRRPMLKLKIKLINWLLKRKLLRRRQLKRLLKRKLMKKHISRHSKKSKPLKRLLTNLQKKPKRRPKLLLPKRKPMKTTIAQSPLPTEKSLPLKEKRTKNLLTKWKTFKTSHTITCLTTLWLKRNELIDSLAINGKFGI